MRIGFLNPQGNFDPRDLYWTEHPDFGGQLVYVKEVAQSMARLGIDVDIFTRRIKDSRWPGFDAEIDYYPGMDNLRIIRIPFGGDPFLRKEDLWPHIGEYVQGIQEYYAEQGYQPDLFTAHYADGGLTGALLQEKMQVPFTFTGHSLGAQKMDKLHMTRENFEQLEAKYHFSNRIEAERRSMEFSLINIVSTNQERFQQYGHPLYQGAIDPRIEERFAVVPPGVNTRIFHPLNGGLIPEQMVKKIQSALERDIKKERLDLPAVIASSRLDPKKNHLGLVQAFAENSALQQRANLGIFLRGIEDPFTDTSHLKGIEAKVMEEIMGIIRQKGLVGKVFFLDLRSQDEIAHTYRYFSQWGGIFALTALYEPFGLAPLEAAASGLPVLVTKNGGPSESFFDDEDEYGVLVDPESPQEIATGLLRVLKNPDEWKRLAQAGLNRVRTRYTWKQTALGYLEAYESILEREKFIGKQLPKDHISPIQLKDMYFQGGGEK